MPKNDPLHGIGGETPFPVARSATPSLGGETPFPVGRDFSPSWAHLEDMQHEGVPTGLPDALLSGEAHTAPAESTPTPTSTPEPDGAEPASKAHAHAGMQPDPVRLHFGLAGLLIGLAVGWLLAFVLL